MAVLLRGQHPGIRQRSGYCSKPDARFRHETREFICNCHAGPLPQNLTLALSAPLCLIPV